METITVAPLRVIKNDNPYGIEIENGQRLLQLYGTTATQMANGEFIVKACNEYNDLVKCVDILQNVVASFEIENRMLLYALKEMVERADMRFPHFEKGSGLETLIKAKKAIAKCENPKQ